MSYASNQASTLKTLTKKGMDVTRRTYTAGTFDPVTSVATPTTADTTRKGVVLDFGAGATLYRNELIQGGDKRLLLDAVGAAPDLKDHYVIGSVEYVVKSIGEVNPAGTPIVYDLHLTK